MRSGATPVFFVAWRIVGVWMALATLSGCSGGDDSEGAPTTDLRYCDVQTIFADRCVRCHSEGGDVAVTIYLDTYDRVEQRATAIKSAITRTGASAMPPVGMIYDVEPPVEPLSDEERDLLVEWITGGAPEGDGTTCD